MFSFSLDNIIALFQGASLLPSVVILIIGIVLGCALAKAWLSNIEKSIKYKEERLSEKAEYFNTILSENDFLKSELEKIKSNPNYWINNRPDKPLTNEKSDIHKV